jgi:hypothetical protein
MQALIAPNKQQTDRASSIPQHTRASMIDHLRASLRTESPASRTAELETRGKDAGRTSCNTGWSGSGVGGQKTLYVTAPDRVRKFCEKSKGMDL